MPSREAATIDAPLPTAEGDAAREFDVVVVGAGFSGLYLLYRLRELGFAVRLLERGNGVGGTWFWNRYPGARCDTESMDYSYSFSPELEQEWSWSERYPRQPEILRYLNHVADRFDLRREIDFETTVDAAHFDETSSRWTIWTEDGRRYSAQFLVMATGCLSAAKQPSFEGLEDFEGDWFLTSAWPEEEIDFTGKRVGVIGTGSTGIQVIPSVARQAEHVTVFQRTANFSVPAKQRPLSDEEQRARKAIYRDYRRRQRESAFGVPKDMEPDRSALDVSSDELVRDLDGSWQAGNPFGILQAYTDVVTTVEANALVAEYVREKIREAVLDPSVAERLCPYDHPIATKRLCVDTDYYETYNRDNVSLVDLRATPIERITPGGVRTTNDEYELDVLIFAIGFDAVTGALLGIDFRGKDGQTLQERWADGPRTYLGVGVPGFPNLFTVTGPQSPSVLTNMVVAIEQHVEWISDCIAYLAEHGVESIEPTLEAESDWVEHTAKLGSETLFPLADSWYMGANVPGKPRVFLPYVGGLDVYRQRCDEIAANGYEGFVLTPAPASSASPS